MGFWAGFAEAIKEKKDADLKRELLLGEQAAESRKSTMTQVYKLMSDTRESATELAKVYNDGVKIFGEEVATILENTGQLDELVTYYNNGIEKGTLDQDWAQQIIGSVDAYKMNLSDEQLAKVLKRGSFGDFATQEAKEDFLAGILSNPNISTSDLFVQDIPPSQYAPGINLGGSTSKGTVGQKEAAVKRMVSSLFGFGIQTNSDGSIVYLDKAADSTEVLAIEAKVGQMLEDATKANTVDFAEAKADVTNRLLNFSQMAEEKSLDVTPQLTLEFLNKKGYNQPEEFFTGLGTPPAPTPAPTLEDNYSDAARDISEAMSAPEVVTPTIELNEKQKEEEENIGGWNPLVFGG